jgi:hypothetical protein
MEICRGALVVRRRNLARFSFPVSLLPARLCKQSDATNKRRGIDHGPIVYFGYRSVLVPHQPNCPVCSRRMPRTFKEGNGANDAIHQVIWAGLRSKQGFVVRRVGSTVTAVSVSLLKLRWRKCEAVVRKNENFVTAASQNNDNIRFSHNKHTA